MNLKNNPNWRYEGVKHFHFNIEINNGNENCKVDYALLNDEGKLLCYGFDLPDDFKHENEIFSFLLTNRESTGDLSLMSKMFKFYEYGDNPIVFLTTVNKIYFMPGGICQKNPFYWESVENLNLFFEKVGISR